MIGVALLAALVALPWMPVIQELPPIPESLLGRSALVCTRIDRAGNVSGAFIIESMGNTALDDAVIAWVRQLHWPPAPTGEGRDAWFPMPVAFGDAEPPPAPASCAPAAEHA